MPIYVFECPFCLRREDHYRAIEARDNNPPSCHRRLMRRVLTPPMVFVQQDVHYTSPVDGRPVTNWQQHVEELARTDTVVYEPGIKQDQERNERRREASLERSIDETVEREVAAMPARKKEKLVAELEGGMTVEPARITPPQPSYRG